MVIYIYSFIEGETKWSHDGPTQIDLDAVGDGQLEVLRVRYLPPDHSWDVDSMEVHSVDDTGKWELATEAELAMTHGQEWHE